MPGDFVPLLKKASPDTTPSFRVKVVADAGPAAPFHPCPRPEPSALGPGASAPPAPAHGDPTVTLERDGDRITGIRIECSCGRVTELTCVY